MSDQLLSAVEDTKQQYGAENSDTDEWMQDHCDVVKLAIMEIRDVKCLSCGGYGHTHNSCPSLRTLRSKFPVGPTKALLEAHLKDLCIEASLFKVKEDAPAAANPLGDNNVNNE